MISGLNSRSLGDLARTDAAGADLEVLRSPVDHRPNPLEIGQPASFAHIVSVRNFVARQRALAADFTSLRHLNVPPQIPHMGVEFNNTGGANYQVCAAIMHSFFAQFAKDLHKECRIEG